MTLIEHSALARLRANLSAGASVNLPGEPNYSIKRWALNAEKPAAVVACPATPEDVAHILAFAQGKTPYQGQPKLHLAVKGGGHTPSGASSSDGGLVVDLQPNMNKIKVDPEAKVAYVSGGCLWGDVDSATVTHGLASVSGVVSHTGVGGLTLGGGFGWLCSQYGLVIDNVVGYTIVTGSGDILKVSSSENADLYWALRGGGGNFGVVTEFVLRLHDQRPDLYSSTMIFPPSVMERLIPEVNAWLKDRTPEENIHIIMANGPTGQPGIMLQGVYNGDSEEGAKKFERFVKLEPVVNASHKIPYIQLNRMQDQLSEHGKNRLLQGNFLPITSDGIPLALFASIFEIWHKFVAENPVAARSVFALELYDAKVWSAVPVDATAYVHRSPTWNLAYIMTWDDSSFTPRAGPLTMVLDNAYTEARDRFFPQELTREGGYMNYLDEESRLANKEFVYKRFGQNFKRLVEVKNKYDNGNLFGRWFASPRN
ncbi:FAD-binding domain protein [Ceratobasidium sp. AG-Ba]|nr:FAD-binding domain protein [Ceratobasidium sp. AG-Ba]QRW06317.1 FAD-binding domain protein [Ceratobasidium sp. AG-Ba]